MITVGPFCLKSIEDMRPFPANHICIGVPPTTSVYAPVHRSSQTSLLALAQYVKPGMTVLDLGTGTGVLAVAAERLGASKVYATDIHPDALELARETFEWNECTRVALICGTFIDEEVDLCIANIDDGEQWVRANLDRIQAKMIIAISDDSKEAILLRGA